MRVEIIDSDYKDNNNTLPNVTTSLTSINRNKSNLEAEKGEVAISPDALNIYKILGKSHGKGGTPLNLEEGSFIFSKDKSLSIDKKLQEKFELKYGQKKIDNTPAKILMRNIDIKHNNQMRAIMEDDKNTDIVSKNTAALMLSKNRKILGKIAYLQESEKEKSEGLPLVSENSQPIFTEKVKTKIDTENQYMRYGGLKKYDKGGQTCPPGFYWNGLACVVASIGGQNVSTEQNPIFKNNILNQYDGYYPNEVRFNMTGKNIFVPNEINAPYYDRGPIGLQHKVSSNPDHYTKVDKSADDYHSRFVSLQKELNPEEKSNQFQEIYNKHFKTLFGGVADFTDGEGTEDYMRGLRENSAAFSEGNSLSKGKQGEIDIIKFSMLPKSEQISQASSLGLTPEDLYNHYKTLNPIETKFKTGVTNSNSQVNSSNINPLKKIDSNPLKVENKDFKDPIYSHQNSSFSTNQLLDVSSSMGLLAMRKNYFPKLYQNSFVPVELEKLNPSQSLQENSSAWLQSARIAASMGTTPQAASFLQKAAIEGISNANKIRDNYESKNVEIGNAQNQYNNQGINNVRNLNVNNRKSYDIGVDTTLGRINEERINGITGIRDKLLNYSQDNKAFDNAMNSREQYAMVDEKGNPILDKNGRPYMNFAYTTDLDGNIKRNRVNGWNSVNSKPLDTDVENKLIQNLLETINSDTASPKEKSDARKSLSLLISSNRTKTKKYGGILKK